jgi:glycosyltransferase involved in cell wall biosynthesis
MNMMENADSRIVDSPAVPAGVDSPAEAVGVDGPAMSARRKYFRLLVIAEDQFPPKRVDVAVLFGQELASRGHRIDWVLQSEPRCDKPYVTQWGGGTAWVGATNLGTSLWSRIHKHILSITHDLKLFSRLRSGEYDCIEVKDKFISGLSAIVAARLYRKRFVYWLSYPFPEDYLHRSKDPTAPYPLLYKIRGAVSKLLLYKVILPAADHVFVQSDQMRRDVAARGIPLEKMTAVPMGISPELFELRADAGRTVIPAGEKACVYIGSLAAVRRMDFLIRAMAKVRDEIPDARLYLVGTADHPGELKILFDETQRLGLEQSVVFVGHLPREQALKYVQDADVCASPIFPTPTLNAGSPTKLIEYMAMGKASVANDHPEQNLVIQESGAGYSVPWDEAAFAKAIVSLMRSPELAKKMGERGRRYALQHRVYSVLADGVEREMLRVTGGDGRP